MIEYLKSKASNEDVFKVINPVVGNWFKNKFKGFSDPQKYAIIPIHNKENILVSAVTGSGKTLTAFTSILSELITFSENDLLENQIYAVYISPLKALSNDVEFNLNQPLKEMESESKKDFNIKVAVRTGDTTQSEKSKMLRKTPHILITTPESFSIVLTSPKLKEKLRSVKWVIIDEIHALAESKRGVHLSLALERLEDLSQNFTRIGLSATAEPIEDIARFLVGSKRKCKIAKVELKKNMDIKVLSPVPDLINVTHKQMHNEMYDLIDNLIQEHKTTLVFTNTRSATERVVHHLKERFPKKYTENIGAHHGSLSKEHRLDMETRMREGKLKAIVCLEGNSKIIDSDGKWIKIKDINEKNVKSLNKEFKLSDNKIITKVTKENNDNLVKIKTSLGKEIICTKEHKFLTINKNGNLEWKEAKDLVEQDYVGTIRKYNSKTLTKKEMDTLFLSNYPDDGYLELKTEFLKKIKSKTIEEYGSIKGYWLKELKNKVSYSVLLQDIRGKFLFKVGTIKKITNDLDIKNETLWESIINFSSDKYRAKKLEMSKELMRLLGFMSAEGYISYRALYVSNRNEKLLKYYSGIIKRLSGRKPFKKLSSSGTPVLSWESIFLSKFLQNIGFKGGRKSRINFIPEFVFSLDQKLVFSFLSGYLDGDGFPETKKDERTYSIGFSTTSKEMANNLMQLLLREEIVSSIRSRYIDSEYQVLNGRKINKKGWFYNVAVIGGSHLRKFIKNINPKRENLERTKKVLSLNGYSNLDIIPNLGVKLRELRKRIGVSAYRLNKEQGIDPTKYELNNRAISRKQLKKLLEIYKNKDVYLHNLINSDIFWERIRYKEKVKKEKFVYNIEVENDHNYIANGFLTKNCSTSLELGIDIGYIDLVILLGSPKSVARCTQRFGRAGHRLHDTIKGRIIVLDRDDLVECSILLKNVIEGKIDRIHIPENCLDVLAQQIYGIAISEKISEKDLWKMITSSYCYRNLKYSEFLEILDYLSGEYTKLEDRHVYAKIWYDKESGMIGKRSRLARMIYMTNIGTIPDETHVQVKIGEQVIGKIDEAFLERLKRGDVFVLGGNKYEFLFSRGMTAQVKTAEMRPPTIPSWFSEMLPLSFDLANDISKFRGLMEKKFNNEDSKEEIMAFLSKYLYLDKNAENAIYEYLRQQYLFEELPNDKKILVEEYKEDNKKFIVFHTLYGRKVNDVLSRAVAYIIGRLYHIDVEIGISDNGFYVSSEKTIIVSQVFEHLKLKDIDSIMKNAIDKTEVLKRRFRHCAVRSLMILRNYGGRTKRVGRQQVSSMLLLNAVRRISEDFPILKESRREVLDDLMDLENAKIIIENIENKKIEVKTFQTKIPSPFAFNLVLEGYIDIMKMEDKVEFLRRMHHLVLAKIGKTKKIE